MSKTTGPILAMGATTIVNRVVFQDEPMDWRIPIATGLAAIGFSMAERAFPDGAQVLAWTAFLATLVTRLQPGVPSPAESAVQWWTKSSGKSKQPAPGGTTVSGQSGSREV